MAQNTEDLQKICETLDKLTLDALSLMEEKIVLSLNTENTMCGGETHIAKARYIMGQNNVSSLQLPTEHSPEFTASTKVYPEEDSKLFGETSYEVHTTDKSEDDTVQNPIRWFGVLVPQNLNYAQNMYRQALQWAIQAVNVQKQLKVTVEKIYELKEAKATILAK